MTTRRILGTNTLQGYAKLGRDSRFFAADEMFRSRGLSALHCSAFVSKNTKIQYKHTTDLRVYVVRLYDDTPYFRYNRTTRKIENLGDKNHAKVLDIQKV